MSFSGMYVKVGVLDLVTMLDHIYRGAKHPEVGFEDIDHTLQSISTSFDKELRMLRSDVESALWSANLLNDLGLFKHHKGYEFDYWVKKTFPKYRFDKGLNLLIEKEEK